MSLAASDVDVYAEAFERFRREVVAGEPAWLGQAREGAFECFRDLGFPSTRLEEWRFTSAAPIARAAFDRPEPQLLGGSLGAPSTPPQLEGMGTGDRCRASAPIELSCSVDGGGRRLWARPTPRTKPTSRRGRL